MAPSPSALLSAPAAAKRYVPLMSLKVASPGGLDRNFNKGVGYRSGRRPRRPLLLGALGLIAAVALAGCATGTIDGGELEAKTKAAVKDQTGARTKSVSCPDDKDAAKDVTFTCAVVGADGTKGGVRVTVTDDEGNAEISAPFVHTREAEHSIAAALTKGSQTKRVTVACPEIVVGRAKRSFKCEADTGGPNATTIKVTQTDAKGGARFEVVKGSGG